MALISLRIRSHVKVSMFLTRSEHLYSIKITSKYYVKTYVKTYVNGPDED